MTGLVEEAVLAAAAGDPVRAERLLARAGRRLHRTGAPETDVLRARIHVTHALARIQRGDRSGAFVLLDEADRLLDGAPANPVTSLAAVQRAGLHGRVGEWAEAAAILEGVRLTPAVAPRTRCLLRLNLGLCYQFLGRYHDSEVQLRRAHHDAVALGQPDLAAAAVHNRGRLRFLLGDLPQALRLMAEAQHVEGGILPPAATIDRARVLAEAALVDQALEALEEGHEAARAGGLTHDLAETDLERARLALLRGETKEARRLASRAELRFLRHSEPAWAVRASLLVCQADLLTGRRRAAVADRLTTLADGPAARSAVGTEAALLAAEANAVAGRLDEARRQLGRPDVRRPSSFPVQLQGFIATIELRTAEGRPDLTRRALRQAAARLAREQARHVSLEGRTAIALHTRRLRQTHVGLALRGGSAAEVLAVTELWRGVSHRLPPVTGSADSELTRLTADARRLHAEARDTDDPTRRAVLLAAARDAERAVAQRELAAPTGRVGVPPRPRPTRAVTVSALRPVLGENGTGILSLFVHRGDLYAVTVTGRGALLAHIGEGPRLVEAVQRLRVDLAARRHAAGTPFAAAVDRSMRRGAHVVGEVLAPVIPATDRLVVLPSQATASIPWRAVPQVAGRPLVVAPSATFWARNRNAPSSGSDLRRTPSVTTLAGPDLPRAKDEAVEVARSWGAGARCHTGAAASGTALREALRSRDVVHVAAHGRHEDENPLFSSVLMADGPTWVHELQRTGVGARHVVLSSCEVGRTHLREGDEGLGLTAGLLSCGVRSVVGAVAPVADEESHAVMTRYHRLLAAGSDAASALEEASAGIPDGALFAVYGSDWVAGLRR